MYRNGCINLDRASGSAHASLAGLVDLVDVLTGAADQVSITSGLHGALTHPVEH